MLHTLTLSRINQEEGKGKKREKGRRGERKMNKKNKRKVGRKEKEKEELREEKGAVGGLLFNKPNVLTSLLLGKNNTWSIRWRCREFR
jgi:hypothetical protein